MSDRMRKHRERLRAERMKRQEERKNKKGCCIKYYATFRDRYAHLKKMFPDEDYPTITIKIWYTGIPGTISHTRWEEELETGRTRHKGTTKGCFWTDWE